MGKFTDVNKGQGPYFSNSASVIRAIRARIASRSISSRVKLYMDHAEHQQRRIRECDQRDDVRTAIGCKSPHPRRPDNLARTIARHVDRAVRTLNIRRTSVGMPSAWT
jgi:hypothetical protein